jgi:DNA-binding transcriptional MerR regulator
MHPQTLRKYERLGLIQQALADRQHALYSREELERLRVIKRLVTAGIKPRRRAALSIAEVMQRIRPLMDEELAHFGQRRPSARPR